MKKILLILEFIVILGLSVVLSIVLTKNTSENHVVETNASQIEETTKEEVPVESIENTLFYFEGGNAVIGEVKSTFSDQYSIINVDGYAFLTQGGMIIQMEDEEGNYLAYKDVDISSLIGTNLAPENDIDAEIIYIITDNKNHVKYLITFYNRAYLNSETCVIVRSNK